MKSVHADCPYDFADQTRFWIWVEKSESCWEWQGTLTGSGYGRLNLQGKRRPAQNIAWEMANGPLPDGLVVDHECHNKSCVNPEHLRLATHKENMENLREVNAGSGYRGVHRTRNRWYGCVTHNYVKHHTATYETPEEANVAVTALRNELFTHNRLDRLVST